MMNSNDPSSENFAASPGAAATGEWEPERTVLCNVFHGPAAGKKTKWDANLWKMNYRAVLALLRKHAEQDKREPDKRAEQKQQEQ